MSVHTDRRFWICLALASAVATSGCGSGSRTETVEFCGKVYPPESDDGPSGIECKDPRVTDLSPLAKFPRLIHLELHGTGASLEPLTGLRLQMLTIKKAAVTDLSALAKITTLTSISIWDTPVKDITPLGNLRNLESVQLNRTQVTDLRPLSGLPRLRSLSVTGSTRETPVAQLPANLSTLEDLTVADFGLRSKEFGAHGYELLPGQIMDTRPVASMPQLLHVDFSQSAVSDLRPLSGLDRLEQLYLRGCPVSDLTALAVLPRLQSLSIDETKVDDLSPLERLWSLESLYFTPATEAHRQQLAHLHKVLPHLNQGPTPGSHQGELAPAVKRSTRSRGTP